MGEITKKVQERRLNLWACDEKRGALCRKEGDENESTGEKEERGPGLHNKQWPAGIFLAVGPVTRNCY